MIIKTIDNNKEYEVSDEPLECGKPYVFSEDGLAWYYAEQWRCIVDAGGRPVLETINPNIKRYLIKREI